MVVYNPLTRFWGIDAWGRADRLLTAYRATRSNREVGKSECLQVEASCGQPGSGVAHYLLDEELLAGQEPPARVAIQNYAGTAKQYVGRHFVIITRTVEYLGDVSDFGAAGESVNRSPSIG